MYFPILRGRQFELIALRELVQKSLLSDSILPIIEPVKISSTLVKTIQVFQDANKNIALIHNPQVGNFISDLKKDKNKQLREAFYKKLKSNNIMDVYYLNPHFQKYLQEISDKEILRSNIITICKNKDCIPVFEKFFLRNEPKYNLIPNESIFRRRIKHNRVIMDDKFEKQNRNTDYAKVDDEPFSDDHLYYKEDGYIGFSDYSIIGDEYNETGFAPYAVAIHIVYFDEENGLRIKHFVSDTNEDITDPAGKFAEAVGKLVKWNEHQKLNTLGINTLIKMYKNGMYPGLGTVKKLSIMHHIELMNRFLNGMVKL